MKNNGPVLFPEILIDQNHKSDRVCVQVTFVYVFRLRWEIKKYVYVNFYMMHLPNFNQRGIRSVQDIFWNVPTFNILHSQPQI